MTSVRSSSNVIYQNYIYIYTHIELTWMISRVLINSSGYVHKVEVNPAIAPAIDEAGIGSLVSSPGLGVKCFLTVS